MRVKKIVAEDFVNYKKPSMFIGSAFCGGKCCLEAGIPLSVCQNDGWRSCAPFNIKDDDICKLYLENDLTEAIVIGGLEPFEQFGELYCFIETLRRKYLCDDDVVVYTGYYPEEIEHELQALRSFKNIVGKFGRFIPNRPHKYDDVLGVELVSDNQYAEKISSQE